MGILVISVVNLISLILGVVAVILVFRLAQQNDNSFLNNYLIFLTLAVITGFCDWIILNWTLVLVKGISADTADLIYHIFWDLVGFPAYLFAFFFLVKAINHLAGIPMRKLYQKLFLTLLIFIIVLNYIGLYLRIKDSPYVFSKAIWTIYTIIWPVAFLAFLAFSSFRRVKNGKTRPGGYSSFVLIHFAGFLIWTLLSLLPLNLGEGRHLIIFAFFLTLFVPALYLSIRRKEFPGSLLIKVDSGLEQSLRDHGFSPREIELAMLLMAGKSNQEISDELFVSVQTVKNYISKMYRKAGVSSRTQFVAIFARYPDPD
jgi:DNA-binding CsgD family transcriptional regulator